MKIVQNPTTLEELINIAKDQFGDLVKAVVDLDKEILVIGGELHADEEALLLEQGGRQEYLWGFNLYPEKPEKEWVEFDSMINIKPSQNNRSGDIENPEIREKILEIINKLIVR
ncbi:MAG: hypothetical protein KGZ93_07035 [Actinobacteria bacterium]|nr:hypothetical protein [Actinomycetota bacterium]